MLNEPRFDNRAHHVFVYRNDETVATTSVPAVGRMKVKLLLNITLRQLKIIYS